MKINFVDTFHAANEKTTIEAKTDFDRLSSGQKIATISASALGALATYSSTLNVFGVVHLSTVIILPLGILTGLVMAGTAAERIPEKSNVILTASAIYAIALICLCGPLRVVALLSRILCLVVAILIVAHTTELFGVMNLIWTPRNNWVSGEASGPMFGSGLGRKIFVSMNILNLNPNKSHNRDEVFQALKAALLTAHPDKNPNVINPAAMIEKIKAARDLLMRNLQLLGS